MLEGTSIDCFALSFVLGLIGRIMLYPASSSNQVVTIRPTGQTKFIIHLIQQERAVIEKFSHYSRQIYADLRNPVLRNPRPRLRAIP